MQLIKKVEVTRGQYMAIYQCQAASKVSLFVGFLIPWISLYTHENHENWHPPPTNKSDFTVFNLKNMQTDWSLQLVVLSMSSSIYMYMYFMHVMMRTSSTKIIQKWRRQWLSTVIVKVWRVGKERTHDLPHSRRSWY
jgi:hypothetical protein